MAVVQCTLNSWKYCAMPKFPTSQKPLSMIKIRINRKLKYESIILGRRRCSQQRGMPWRARGESWLYLWLQHYRSTSKEMHWQPSRNMWADLCQGHLSNITQKEALLACSVRNCYFPLSFNFSQFVASQHHKHGHRWLYPQHGGSSQICSPS